MRAIKHLSIENLGIAVKSNAAIAWLQGSGVGLLDHEEFASIALFGNRADPHQRPDTEYVYPMKSPSEMAPGVYAPQIKPDWSPDTLRSTNYPTHFSFRNAHCLTGWRIPRRF
jgi:hypothetical protein